MACRGEHFPVQAATKSDLKDGGVVASRPVRLAAIFSPGKQFEARFSLHYPLLFTLGNKIQNGLKMEKPSSLHLSRLTNTDTAEVPLARAFVKFGSGKSAGKIPPLPARCPNPDRKSVVLVVK